MGTLYSVATPIGNLADITFRAVEVLKQVNLILCEDTRVTRHLLEYYGIKTPYRAYHQHSSVSVVKHILADLAADKTLAMVSDAGTPTISDPGSNLIQQVIAAGHQVIPIPGASAVICALQAAGVDTSQFVFYGFLPHKKGRQTLLNTIKASKQTVVFYESIHRINKTMQALADCNKQIVVCRELTKKFEEFIRGSAAEVAKAIARHPTLKGECVVIVSADDIVMPR